MEKSTITTQEKEIVAERTTRELTSDSFTIKTKAIVSLEKQVKRWISCDSCGAIIYGRTRVGKTRAMQMISSDLKEHYGDSFPVFMWYMTDHAVTEFNFYASILNAMGIARPNNRTTALVLKDRVVNQLVYLGNQTPYKRVVFFIDEAYLMAEKDFSWLMDLYNILNDSRYGIQLLCFLLGTSELIDMKVALKTHKKHQIVERFMIREAEFHGLSDIDEYIGCLNAFDAVKTVPYKSIPSVSLKEFYFPNADKKDSFLDIAYDFYNAFNKIRTKHNLSLTEMPMKYFIDTFILCLSDYGCLSDTPRKFLSYNEISDCMEKSGLSETEG